MPVVVLCPGQGAQAVGMGSRWAEVSDAARAVFDEADRILADSLERPLSQICFSGPPEDLNRTDLSQPAIYTCSIASYIGLRERGARWSLRALAGLSLGEYTALHLAKVFDFETGLRLVALRGRLMQEASDATDGGMVALTGADETRANEICESAAGDRILVCANFNAPGQIVLSGQRDACERAARVASEIGLRATPLKVAGAFHSPLMKSAAEDLADALAEAEFEPPEAEIWSNVTAVPHDREDMELLRRRLVEQLTSPVRWAQLCEGLVSRYSGSKIASGVESLELAAVEFHELAPGSVLRGLMRRIDRNTKVENHEEP